MTDDRLSRRRIVQVMGGIAAVGLAGCLDSGGEDGNTPTDGGGGANTDDTMEDGMTADGMTDGGEASDEGMSGEGMDDTTTETEMGGGMSDDGSMSSATTTDDRMSG